MWAGRAWESKEKLLGPRVGKVLVPQHFIVSPWDEGNSLLLHRIVKWFGLERP